MPPRNRAAKKTTRTQERAARSAPHTRPTTSPPHTTTVKPRTPLGGARKPSVSIIGAGRLGAALAIALEQSGHRIDALVATTRAHARRSARLLSTPTLALAASELDQLPDSPVVIIATPDDRVAETAARLASALRQRTGGNAADKKGASADAPARVASHERATDTARDTTGDTASEAENEAENERERVAHKDGARVVLHASGALSSRELEPLGACGFSLGSLHPLVSVSDPAANSKDFAGAYFCVEGEARAARAALSLVRSLGGRAFTIAARDKALYHAAALFAAGHVVALFDLSTELFALCGIPRAEARRIFLPLARGTADNLASSRKESAALTGPFSRADAATVRRHLGVLAATGVPRDALALYTLLGLRSLRLAAEQGVDESRLAEIARLLTPLAEQEGWALATEDTEGTERKVRSRNDVR